MKIDQLTFTRFLAAFLVAAFHHHRGSTLFINSDVFVSFFYVLSGFVLIISQKLSFHSSKEYIIFYINRIARIFPVYLLALFLFIFLNPKIEQDLILHILGVQAFFYNSATNYNFPGWSISVELFFYLCYPFLLNCFYNRFALEKVVCITIAFWATCQLIFSLIYYSPQYAVSPTLQSFIKYNPINHLNEFICGNVAAMIFKKKFNNWQGNYDVIVLIFIGIIITYLSFFRTPMNLFDHNGLLIIIFLPTIFFLSLNTGLITRLFNYRIFVLLGEISFGLYILSEPVFSGLSQLSSSLSIEKLRYFHYSMLALLVFCYLVYVYFEKPLQKTIRNLGAIFTYYKQPKAKSVYYKEHIF